MNRVEKPIANPGIKVAKIFAKNGKTVEYALCCSQLRSFDLYLKDCLYRSEVETKRNMKKSMQGLWKWFTADIHMKPGQEEISSRPYSLFAACDEPG